MHSSNRNENIKFVSIAIVTGGLTVKEPMLALAVDVRDVDMNVLLQREYWIKQTKHTLDSMGGWAKDNHGKMGWIQKSIEATSNLEGIETEVLMAITNSGAPRWSMYKQSGSIFVARNPAFIRMFLKAYMPKLNDHFNHNDISTGSLDLMFSSFTPRYPQMAKVYDNQPLEKATAAIEELKFYGVATSEGAKQLMLQHTGEIIPSHVNTEEWLALCQ